MFNNFESEDVTLNLIENIIFSNTTFYNRLDDYTTLKEEDTFLELVKSINTVGLLNPIYLQKIDNNYIIINGFRRSLALKEIFSQNKTITFKNKAIIFEDLTSNLFLEKISLDENTQRKNLSFLELSYKLNEISSKKQITIDECLKKFNISKSQFHAIKKALDFDPFIKKFILQAVGPIKADILNRILELLLIHQDPFIAQSTIKTYTNKPLNELKSILKELQNIKTEKNDLFEFKKRGHTTFFRINELLSDEDYLKIQTFIKTLLKR
ncbi:ParB/RepB/Spo0J family partition protein [Cetobacterium sp.]|uniref:ParB/RepB/Spo0J family partition protein n=1 Tax=Cetobacterium sp. TaxID=2071632 RepID=UPI003F3011D3